MGKMGTTEGQALGEVQGDRESDGLEVHSPVQEPAFSVAGSSRERKTPMFSLTWNGFDHHIKASLVNLYSTEELTDVTLVCEDGETIRAHKLVLAMSSQFFRHIFKESPSKHPIVILKGLRFQDVQHVLHFIYMGEVRVREEEIDAFIEAAESLRIDGINSSNQHYDSSSYARIETVRPLRIASRTESNASAGSPELGQAPKQYSWNMTSPKPVVVVNQVDLKQQRSPRTLPSRPSGYAVESPPNHMNTGIADPLGSNTLAPTMQHFERLSPGRMSGHHFPSSSMPRKMTGLRSNSNESRISDLSSAGSQSPMLDLKRSRRESGLSHDGSIDFSRGNGIPHDQSRRFSSEDMHVAEDLRKTSDQSYELSLLDGGASSVPPAQARSLSPRSPYQGYSNEKRSTSWATDTTTSHPAARHGAPPSYLPLSLVAASAIASHTSPSASFKGISHKSIPVTSQQQLLSIGHFGRPHNPFSAATTLSALKARLTASATAAGPSPPFPHISHSYSHKTAHGIRPATTSSHSAPPPLKPKTKAIRSSQVPQSARYTAAEVDAMVDKVEKFPGPLVPCVVCQKFVKRERLRAHIHECHLLHGERIICQHCGIGLKSKGSFRVHIWRHKRGNLSVKPPNDP